MDLCNLHIYHMLLALCYETIWLHHIGALVKILIQECSLDIHLSYFITEMCCNGQEYYDGLEHGYRTEGFLIVETRFLTITLLYKLNIICLNLFIYFSFPLLNPLALYGFYPFKRFYKFPNLVKMHGQEQFVDIRPFFFFFSFLDFMVVNIR